MSLMCVLGFHKYGNGFVKFTEPLKSGRFDEVSHKVQYVQNCVMCGKAKVSNTYIYTEEDFNLIPRKEIDSTTNNKIKSLIKDGFTNKEIVEKTGASLSTVKRRRRDLA